MFWLMKGVMNEGGVMKIGGCDGKCLRWRAVDEV